MPSFDLRSFSGILRRDSYRRFWIGFAISATGDAITSVALAWIVLERTHSAAALGELFVLLTAPVILGGFLAGWLLDRYDRRKVMIADNLIRGIGIFSIPVLNWLGLLTLNWIFGVATLYGLLFMISLAGGPSILPDLVHESELATANSMETLGYTVSGVAGAPLAGVLIGIVGGPNVLVVDAACYGIFIAALLSIRVNPPAFAEDKPGDKIRLLAGFQLLGSSPVLLSTTLMFMMFNVGSGLQNVWLPIFVTQGLGGGAALYGLLLGALAAGSAVGALIGGSYTGRVPTGTLICASQVLSGCALVLLLVRPDSWVALVSLGLLGAASAPLTIWAQTLRMKLIPTALRGRAFALLRTLMQGATPAGSAAGGLIIPVAGLATTIGLTAGVMSAPGAVGYVIPNLRNATGGAEKDSLVVDKQQLPVDVGQTERDGSPPANRAG